MTGYAELLDDAEILAVLSSIKSTWPPRVRANHDRLDQASRRHPGRFRAT